MIPAALATEVPATDAQARDAQLTDARAPAAHLPADSVVTLPAGSGFSLADPAARTSLRRTWLDTFDWRLYRAGLTLEQVTGSGAAQLRLTARDGSLVAAERLPPARAGRPRWPARMHALPAGPLAEHLAPVVGVRALLPVARVTSMLREHRALNGDGKTIARIIADTMTVSAPPAPPAVLPVRVTVTAVRGYGGPAARLAGMLAARPGVLPAGQSGLDAALAAGGRWPGDYSGRLDVELTPAMPAARAMAQVFEALLDTLVANVAGAAADIDTEFLHDLRIAVRRSRAGLKLAGHVLPGGLRGKFRPDFRWLGDLTTPTRDLDVYLLGLPAMTASLVGASAADLGPFGEHLRRQRAKAQRELARGLRSARFQHLCADWRSALAAAAATARARPAAARLAAVSIAGAHQAVLAGGAAITLASPAESLHDLRKRCKELRYLLEFFASLHDPGTHWRAVRELKGLQDCLGEFQDTDVQRSEITAFATQMMAQQLAPAHTLLAMGEIAAGLARRQHQAREEFAGLFAALASPPSQDRIRALTKQART